MITKLEILKIVRSFREVNELFEKDKNSEIYINLINKEGIEQINKEYPELLETSSSFIYSVNVLSSKTMNEKGYKKFRYYIDSDGNIVRRFQS